MTRMKYHFTTKDLVTIALLSALGGVLSTYVGYLGNMVNHIVGVPFGAGQFLSGLHVIWIMLAIALTRKKGAGTVTGLVKGIIELFMGSTHGIVIVVVSMMQGIIPDMVMFKDSTKSDRNIYAYTFAGGLSAATNVVVFQIFFFAGIPIILIAMLCMLAYASGMIFGGWLVLQMLDTLETSGIVRGRKPIIVDSPEFDEKAYLEQKGKKKKAIAAMSVVVAFLAVFAIGGVYYYMFVFVLPGSDTIEITGDVQNPYDFRYSDFENQEVTINAELIGSVTYVAPKNYTGVPINIIIEESSPGDDASDVVVWGSDGYTVVFSFVNVMSDDNLILTAEDDIYTLVAAEYEGAYWVEDVVKIEVR